MNTEQLRRHLQDGKLVFGLSQCRKLIASGDAQTVLMASNAPAAEVSRVRSDAASTGVKTQMLESDNRQLGVMCRRPHPISFCVVTK